MHSAISNFASTFQKTVRMITLFSNPVAGKHAEMSVKNDANGGENR